MKPQPLCSFLVKARDAREARARERSDAACAEVCEQRDAVRAGMHKPNEAARVLRALYELAQLDCPADADLLGRALGISASDARRVLLELEARGFACAQRARLTMLGLGGASRLAPLHLDRKPWLAKPKAAAVGPSLRRVAL